MLAPARVRIQLLERHAAQERIACAARRFNVLDCGRRFGKDVLGIDLLAETALDCYPAAWYSPTYKNLTEVWRYMANLLEPATERRSEQEHRLQLYGGGTIDMWSLDSPDTSRGRAYKRIVVNEAAMIARLQEAWEQVIRPTLADYIGDAWFLSTPKGFNYFKTLFDRGQDPTQTDWISWQLPTSANPFIALSEIEAARLELPEKTFAQEYLASFVADEAGVFRRLLEAATLDPQEPQPGHQYVITCDWGKVNDYSIFSVGDLTTKRQVYLDRSNRIDYALQVARLKALCDRYKPAMTIAELNSMGQAIIESVQRAGIRVTGWTATQASKQKIVEDLAVAFEQEQFPILRDAVQLAELQGYEATRTPSGLMRYAAPEGQHDDTVLPLALLWQVMMTADRRRLQQVDFRWSN